MDLVRVTEEGLFCEAGGFYIDPWRAVDRAVITHSHSDHARPGSKAYLTCSDGVGLLRERIRDANIQQLPYGEKITMGGVELSLHPAGHVLGSCQVKVTHRGESWVVTGDYKTESDPTCASFVPVPCHTLITESTFGLPIYKWPAASTVYEEVRAWWRENSGRGRTSVLFCYALGKAQRILIGLGDGPILLHGAILRYLPAYRAAGVAIPDFERHDAKSVRLATDKPLILAPPSAKDSPWLRQFGEISTAFASGWMRIRGVRRRRNLDRGFIISDHADWDGLLASIEATGADRILVTHGYAQTLARVLRARGKISTPLATPFEGENSEADESTEKA